MAQGFVDTRHGCIHYMEEGSGKPLVLLHSNGASVCQYGDRNKVGALGKTDLYEQSVGKNNVAVLADCGHFPMIDDSALFVTEVDRLIRQVSR